jgi:hypothetical protein
LIKEAVIGFGSTAANQIVSDRFYLRYHGPDVVRISGPWLRRYESYKAYDPPPEAVARFGAKRGRYSELWFSNLEEYRGRPNLTTATLPPQEGKNAQAPDQTVIMVPALPTEEFLVKQLDPEQTTIMRWVCGIKYPEGVSVEEGEKWYLEVHAQEAKQQIGLLGFYSHRALKIDFASPAPIKDTSSPVGLPAATPEQLAWVRVTEMWYEDMDAWRKAVLESPPKYTPPPWGGEYPFVTMVSNFIDLKPDVDFLKGNYTIP